MDERERALRVTYDSFSLRGAFVWFTLEQWLIDTKDVDVYPQYDQGELIGAILVRGREAHYAILRRPYSRPDEAIKIFRGLMKEHGYIKTKILSGKPGLLRFAEWLGFVKEEDDGRMVTMTCKEFRYG